MTQEAGTNTRLGQILVPRHALFGVPPSCADPADYRLVDCLELFVEEMIAHGAVGLAVEEDPDIRRALDEIHPAFRDRVRLVAHNQRTQAQLARLTVPLHLWLHSAGPKEHLGQIENLARLYNDFHACMSVFVLGMEHRLHIPFPVTDVRSTIDTLRLYMKTPETRAVLANIAGVLASYEPVSIPGVLFKSTATAPVGSHVNP